MSRRTRKALNPFQHPGSDQMEYAALLEAMRDCRKQVHRLTNAFQPEMRGSLQTDGEPVPQRRDG